ncbi:unnamed protein product [Adineta steineri]|uniref:SMP-30/Gluconolactonase/LRE-like region domain-containing protein n=1 Tax=Adineta steineri TaxID=433720 RepID=A0A813S286_9BILA|nr:unnamed protein product [Adineta steineri]CAF0793750.1 unnamed protein product [Adineta steineri]
MHNELTHFLDTLCSRGIWARGGKTVIGGTQGNATNQLHSPEGIYMDSTNALYIVDRLNHRIIKWEQEAITGNAVAGGIGPGVKPGELFQPRAMTVDKQGTMYIIDNSMPGSRVTRWQKGSKVGEVLFDFKHIIAGGIAFDPNDEDYLYLADRYEHSVLRFNIKNITGNGEIVAGGNHIGPALNQLEQHTRNSRIVVWSEGAKVGVVVGGGHGAGNQTDQLSFPEAFFLDRLTNTIYVADKNNNRVMRISADAPNAGFVIAGNDGKGNAAHQLPSPHGIALDSKGNLYVSDNENDRIQMFMCSSSAKFIGSLYFITLTIIFIQ